MMFRRANLLLCTSALVALAALLAEGAPVPPPPCADPPCGPGNGGGGCTSDAQCDDGNFCTIDQCMGGNCVYFECGGGTYCDPMACVDGSYFCGPVPGPDCGGQVCDDATESCVDCVVDGDCTPDVCDTGTNTCVECNNENDCSGATPACDAGTSTCVECLDDSYCPGEVCDMANSVCVECLDDGDCNAGPQCWLGICNPNGNNCGYAEDDADNDGFLDCTQDDCAPGMEELHPNCLDENQLWIVNGCTASQCDEDGDLIPNDRDCCLEQPGPAPTGCPSGICQ